HLFDGLAGKSIGAWIPVAISIEPAVVERGPLDPQLLQLRNRAQHLRWGDVEFVAPTAPAHVVGFSGRLRNIPSLFLQNARPKMQRLVKISRVDRNETARRG